jgi:hypothetical protein
VAFADDGTGVGRLVRTQAGLRNKRVLTRDAYIGEWIRRRAESPAPPTPEPSNGQVGRGEHRLPPAGWKYQIRGLSPEASYEKCREVLGRSQSESIRQIAKTENRSPSTISTWISEASVLS